MRIVLDANVLISGVFWSGYPFRVLDLWANDKLTVLVSEAILREYADTLGELGTRQGAVHLADTWVKFVFNHSTLVDVETPVDVCRDPDDNKYLACAIDGAAETIVSGDKDLLDLGKFRDIPIVNPRRFVDAFLKRL